MKTDEVVLELKLPIHLPKLAAAVRTLEQIHGKHALWMRQAGEVLQIYKPSPVSPNNEKMRESNEN
jgi:hypothetical protein